MRLIAAIACIALVAAAEAAVSTGDLDERGLALHEAWTEARLSMDHERLEQEWSRLIDHLKVSLRGKARVKVTGNVDDWAIELKPVAGPMTVLVDSSGVRLITAEDNKTPEARTLLRVYPWRRHYDCAGRALNPSHPGVPVRGKTCTPPVDMEWRIVAQSSAGDGEAIVQPVPRLPGCYLVVSERGGVLIPGQVLVDQDGKHYAMERMSDDKLRLPYHKNRRLFVMSEKQPAGSVLQ